jgi:hypothetical protein
VYKCGIETKQNERPLQDHPGSEPVGILVRYNESCLVGGYAAENSAILFITGTNYLPFKDKMLCLLNLRLWGWPVWVRII